MMNIRVLPVHFHVDSKLKGFIEKRLQRLEKLLDKTDIKVEVLLKLQDTGSAVRQKTAEILLHVPGGWLVDKKTDLSFESAIIASVDTLKRQLVRRKEKSSTYRRDEF
jgi:putative sigma-54 modulation protein